MSVWNCSVVPRMALSEAAPVILWGGGSYVLGGPSPEGPQQTLHPGSRNSANIRAPEPRESHRNNCTSRKYSSAHKHSHHKEIQPFLGLPSSGFLFLHFPRPPRWPNSVEIVWRRAQGAKFAAGVSASGHLVRAASVGRHVGEAPKLLLVLLAAPARRTSSPGAVPSVARLGTYESSSRSARKACASNKSRKRVPLFCIPAERQATAEQAQDARKPATYTGISPPFPPKRTQLAASEWLVLYAESGQAAVVTGPFECSNQL